MQKESFQVALSKQITDHKCFSHFYQWDKTCWKPHLPKAMKPIKVKPLKVMSLNILFDARSKDDLKPYKANVKYSQERFAKILEIINTEKPDLITLNEVTHSFVVMAEQNEEIRERYFISENSEIGLQSKQSLNNVILTSLEPSALHLVFLSKLPRPVPTAFFAFECPKQTKIVTFSSVHLTAYFDRVPTRVKQLKNLKAYLSSITDVTNEHVLMGDMNFHHESQNSVLEELEWKDAWTSIHSLEENPGYTFDGVKNMFVDELYWGFEKRRMRLDRIFFSSDFCKVKDMEVTFNEPIYGQKCKNQGIGWFKSGLSFLFDLANKNVFREKENYLFCSDHFGLKATLELTDS